MPRTTITCPIWLMKTHLDMLPRQIRRPLTHLALLIPIRPLSQRIPMHLHDMRARHVHDVRRRPLQKLRRGHE
jgi:hypothetical protein